MELITPALVRSLLPKRSPDGHKGTFGKVHIYGGCVGYTGAPVYAGEAASRTGSGLVFAAVPPEVYSIIAAHCNSTMAYPVPNSYDALLARMRNSDAVLIGPGLGQEAGRTVCSLMKDLSLPIVLDADGINAVSRHINVLTKRLHPTVVTPHEGEFLRLGGDLSQGREKAAAEFVQRCGCVLVLKGPGTIVAAPDGRLFLNPTGNSGMAKGGSGDVLAGMVLSLIGQGAEAVDAAVCAVWLHGRAGDLCRDELTEYAMIPSDLIERLPAVFRELGLED